ncbi:hypothetical protein AB3N59_18675 [Leptospira sp. WS92.C1]
MPKVIRTTDFVAEVKDLARRGYTKTDIAKRLAKTASGKTVSTKTIRKALTEGAFRGKK